MPAAELPQTPSTVPQPLASAVLDLRDRMYNAGTYSDVGGRGKVRVCGQPGPG